MMHRFLCPRINDASIISPSYQRCIDYLPPASLMHRLSPSRIIDASIIAIMFDASMHRLISIIDADPYGCESLKFDQTDCTLLGLISAV